MCDITIILFLLRDDALFLFFRHISIKVTSHTDNTDRHEVKSPSAFTFLLSSKQMRTEHCYKYVFSPVTTCSPLCLPVVGRGATEIPAVSPQSRMFVLDGAEQLGDVLLSGLVHLYHSSLDIDMGRGHL